MNKRARRSIDINWHLRENVPGLLSQNRQAARIGPNGRRPRANRAGGKIDPVTLVAGEGGKNVTAAYRAIIQHDSGDLRVTEGRLRGVVTAEVAYQTAQGNSDLRPIAGIGGSTGHKIKPTLPAYS